MILPEEEPTISDTLPGSYGDGDFTQAEDHEILNGLHPEMYQLRDLNFLSPEVTKFSAAITNQLLGFFRISWHGSIFKTLSCGRMDKKPKKPSI